jgi:hypothetical protein
MSIPLLTVYLPFCPLAGLVAFLITYEEYSHHRMRHRAILQRSITTGLVATLFFALLGLGLSVILPGVVSSNS